MSICRVGVRILVPIDGSKHSERALETAVGMAKKFDGKVTLIHVVSPLPTLYLPVPEVDLAAAGKAVTKAGEKLLGDAKEKATAEGVKVETLLKIGHPVGEIIKTCKKGEFDMIVMGARGISGVEELFLGSVSHGVIKHVNLPVLVVR